MATSWKFYLNSRQAWDAMYEDCTRAERSIDIEQYIFDDKPANRRFVELLKAKARAGLRVRLLCDMVGSYALSTSPRVKEFQEAGVQLIFFNRVKLWRLSNFTSWFFRDHRKLLVVDSAVGYTGGVGLNELTAQWRDTTIRITGPVVAQMETAFEKMWIGAGEHYFISTPRPYEFWDDFGFIINAPRLRQRHFYQLLLRAIRGARQCIYLATPYYVPTVRFVRALQQAARRGVDVRLLVPLTTDHTLVDRASQSYYGITMKAGVRIFRYLPAMMHAKAFVVDEAWAAVGSSNLDSQGFTFSYEGNIVTTNRDCVAQLKQQFLEDFAQSEELKRQVWEARSYAARLLEALTWPIHWVL